MVELLTQRACGFLLSLCSMPICFEQVVLTHCPASWIELSGLSPCRYFSALACCAPGTLLLLSRHHHVLPVLPVIPLSLAATCFHMLTPCVIIVAAATLYFSFLPERRELGSYFGSSLPTPSFPHLATGVFCPDRGESFPVIGLSADQQ